MSYDDVARGAHRSRPTPTPRWLIALVATALLVTVAACGGGGGASGADADADPVHIHGLGVNPADSAIYIATHSGLFRMEQGSDRIERIGDRRQDTMGFTVVGADHFLGSGHPDLRDGLPPLLGLIESRDAGRSWESVSLLGKADFHALRTTGSLIHGFDASGERLMASIDGGRTWATTRAPGPLADVVVDPENLKHLVAAGQSGLVGSRDGGRRWSPLKAPPGLLAWPRREALYSLAFSGAVSVSRDGGSSWSALGTLPGEPAAVTVPDAQTLIVALHDGRFLNSSDGGRTWEDGAWEASE